MKYLELTVGAVLVYNFVLSRFLGICPFLGVSKRLSTAMGMSGAVIFVMTLASFITTLLYRNVLQFSFGGENLSAYYAGCRKSRQRHETGTCGCTDIRAG